MIIDIKFDKDANKIEEERFTPEGEEKYGESYSVFINDDYTSTHKPAPIIIKTMRARYNNISGESSHIQTDQVIIPFNILFDTVTEYIKKKQIEFHNNENNEPINDFNKSVIDKINKLDTNEILGLNEEGLIQRMCNILNK